MPLITCSEASPLIGALLQQPVTCISVGLSGNFLDALHSAYLRYRKRLSCISMLCYHVIENRKNISVEFNELLNSCSSKRDVKS